MSESHIYTFDIEVYDPSRNPLKSGQCFLRLFRVANIYGKKASCRNPLESGQCFLPIAQIF